MNHGCVCRQGSWIPRVQRTEQAKKRWPRTFPTARAGGQPAARGGPVARQEVEAGSRPRQGSVGAYDRSWSIAREYSKSRPRAALSSGGQAFRWPGVPWLELPQRLRRRPCTRAVLIWRRGGERTPTARRAFARRVDPPAALPDVDRATLSRSVQTGCQDMDRVRAPFEERVADLRGRHERHPSSTTAAQRPHPRRRARHACRPALEGARDLRPLRDSW